MYRLEASIFIIAIVVPIVVSDSRDISLIEESKISVAPALEAAKQMEVQIDRKEQARLR